MPQPGTPASSRHPRLPLYNPRRHFGVPAAVALGRLLEARLFGVARADAMGLAVFSAVICGAALLSALSPAIRAAAVDPAAILRAE